MTEPSLFDDEPGEWHEVPDALFLSWSDARQLAYCAARDEHAAATTELASMREFYAARAMRYRNDLREKG